MGKYHDFEIFCLLLVSTKKRDRNVIFLVFHLYSLGNVIHEYNIINELVFLMNCLFLNGLPCFCVNDTYHIYPTSVYERQLQDNCDWVICFTPCAVM